MRTFPRDLTSGVLATLLLAASLAATACTGSRRADADDRAAESVTVSSDAANDSPDCPGPLVSYRPYPGHATGLGGIHWVQGEPARLGPVALLWYWPTAWTRREVRDARIFTGGVAPAGYNVKILWAFLAPEARGAGGRNLFIHGRRLDGSGSFRAGPFAAIGYTGQRDAPSYASTVDIPTPGCWRLRLSTGSLTAKLDVRAVPGGQTSG